MSVCSECEHYREELDINYQECFLNQHDKYWFTKVECPDFKQRPDLDVYGDDRNES